MTTVNKLLDKARLVCSSDAEIARRPYRRAGKVVFFRDEVRRLYRQKRVCGVDGAGPGPGLRRNVIRALRG